MFNPAAFGEITKERLEIIQEKEDYAECYKLYRQSNLDIGKSEVRKMKLIFYKILASYLLYDPQIDKALSNRTMDVDFSIFSSIDKNDPEYVNKLRAILSVLYYCVKNRCYNYALNANADHGEIMQNDELICLLESNSAVIINGKNELVGLFSALLMLLYDKLLGATVELVHEGRDVPTSVTTYNFGGGYTFGDINYKNTTKVQRINALQLIQKGKYRQSYIERRNYWKQNISDKNLSGLKNSFLYGTYELKQINSFLAEFDFRLFDICTKYYKNYFCYIHTGISMFKKLFYLATGNEEKLEEVTKKHRNWTYSSIALSAVKVFLMAVIIGVPFIVLLGLLGGDIAEKVGILITCCIFFTPLSRILEKNKRIKYYLA